MIKVNIVDRDKDTLDITESSLLSELMIDGTYQLIMKYKIPESFILKYIHLFDKEILLEGISFTEDFINNILDSKYLLESEISILNMSTYSNLSAEFIIKYKEYINWSRMILLISTNSDTFDDYIDIIDSNDLWSLVSSNDLPVDFIRTWKDKLDWKYLSLVKNFTSEEEMEFSDYICRPDTTIEIKDFDISENFVKPLSIDDISKLIDDIKKI